MQNRRRFRRLSEEWKIDYRVLEEGWFSGDAEKAHTSDISGGGICFKTDKPLQPGTLIIAELESMQLRAPILAFARVIWCQQIEQTHFIAVEFRWANWKDNAAQQTVTEYIAKEISA